MIYTTLFAAIESRLATVAAIKVRYAYPVEKVSQYPAAIYFPDGFENAFQSNADNQNSYRFKIFVVVGAAQKDKVDIFSTILPKAVDAVLAAFDTGWDAGTIDGHRIRVLVSAGAWTMAQMTEGLEAQAELTVEFRLLTSL